MKVPFNGVYAPNVGLVILTLFPQLINTAAYASLDNAIARDLHVSARTVLQYPLLSEAAFVFGILAGTSLIRRFNLRPVFFFLLAADVVVALLISFANSNVELAVLNVLAGLLGGMFLMVALPPLFMNFDEKYFAPSAALMVPCLFGAATLAPIVCAPLAAAGLWRPLFWGEALALSLAWMLALLTIGSKEPPQKDAPVDWYALGVGAFSMACVFAGISNIGTHEWTYLPALVPFVAGVAGFVVLIAGEYFMQNALLPVKQILVSFAVIGFIAAGAGNAIYIADTQVVNILTRTVLHLQPFQIASMMWPLFAMTVLVGVIFSLALRTKWMPLIPLLGLFAICCGSGLFLAQLEKPSPALQLASIVLIGYGASASITPGLFMVGLSMPKDLVARAIAAIEVVRLTLGFISGPLAQHADTLHGIRWTMVYVTAFALFASILLLLLLLKYYRHPHAPNLGRYVHEGQPAFDSPAL